MKSEGARLAVIRGAADPHFIPLRQRGVNPLLAVQVAARASQFVAAGGAARDNRSAFFFRLLLPARSTTAEILVSDLCELSPAAAHRRVFLLPRGARSPGALFLESFRPVFLVVLSCFVSTAFFSRDYKVLCCIFADFRPVNRLYFCGRILTRLDCRLWSTGSPVACLTTGVRSKRDSL
jgi:hypothetical protein